MKNILVKLPRVLMAFLFAVALIQPLTVSSTHATPVAKTAPAMNKAFLITDDPEAVYQSARIVHNVTVKGQKGMRVHAKFTVKYGLDVACKMIAYFYYDDSDNTPLAAGDPKYRTRDGNVSAYTNFTPAYDPAVYNDLQIFIPYDALNMESGEHDLKFYLALYDNEGQRFFGKSGWYKFQLTMP
ncbi:MAG TPA: hypothetical protein VJT71_01225 [Pyrinomonadaceae bacterium]|nr:hypothetical protein [Pyrinomonadaceae bacterium]